jgi:hypothetical protein
MECSLRAIQGLKSNCVIDCAIKITSVTFLLTLSNLSSDRTHVYFPMTGFSHPGTVVCETSTISSSGLDLLLTPSLLVVIPEGVKFSRLEEAFAGAHGVILGELKTSPVWQTRGLPCADRLPSLRSVPTGTMLLVSVAG